MVDSDSPAGNGAEESARWRGFTGEELAAQPSELRWLAAAALAREPVAEVIVRFFGVESGNYEIRWRVADGVELGREQLLALIERELRTAWFPSPPEERRAAARRRDAERRGRSDAAG
jgi:hypothetical protein